MFGPSCFWTMPPLRNAANFDPFLSLDCSPALHPCAIQGKEGIKFCHLATVDHRTHLVSVAGDLLLVRGAPAVLVAHRVDVLVRVDPAGLAVRVPQGDLRPVGDLLRLALHDRAQAALQRGLKLETKYI